MSESYAGKITPMSSLEKEVVPQESLVNQLIDEAHKLFNGDNFSSYLLYIGQDENKTRGKRQITFPLDSKYRSLVFGDDPAKYKIVYYLDYREHNDHRYANRQIVGLSTNQNRKTEENLLREIDYRIEDDSIFVEVGEFINGAQNYDFETDLGSYILMPRGSLSAEYKLLDNGDRQILNMMVTRVDDTKLSDGHARWYRTLSFPSYASDFDLYKGISYQDSFFLDDSEGRAFIITDGSVERSQRIHVIFGNNKRDLVEIMRSSDRRAVVSVSKGEEEMVEFFKQFPEYNFLKKNRWFKRLTFEDLQFCLQERIRQIQEHWNKSSNIFTLVPELVSGS